MTKEDAHNYNVKLLKDIVQISQVLEENLYKNDLLGDTYVIDKKTFDSFFSILKKDAEIIVKKNYKKNVILTKSENHQNNEINNLIEIINK